MARYIKLILAFGLIMLFLTITTEAKYAPGKPQKLDIVVPLNSHARILYGAQKLADALNASGYSAKIVRADVLPAATKLIIVGLQTDALLKNADKKYQISAQNLSNIKEGFSINSTQEQQIIIAGSDYSGALYGCLELAERIKASHQIPEHIAMTDHPEMVLRGTCIGLQKSTYLPGRGVYEYPYTPETFPWFYDKQLWIKYLDQMAQNRMNSLYLWNGHPFASLVKLKDYPYAVEVSDSTFKMNEDMFRFLTTEADKRGIWVIQGFYNIIVSKPFGEVNHIKTQDRSRHIVPIIADYTRKSIAAFVAKYPNVGLLITLGEAMEGVGQDDIDWLTKTIIPGVKDGLKELGRTDEPPIVLRAHDTDAPADMKYALPLYKNLYTMAKYNGEALTTYTPRGPWADLHRTLSGLGSVQIENVHIMANLEPFRYGSADFVQKCVLAMHNTYGANGVHVYPQASYWDWPYAADNAPGRLYQMDRDWIWYAEWARYAWNCHRDRAGEVNYWSGALGAKYGCDTLHGKDILDAYELSGEIAPKLLRRFGITDGNRQTLTLGMLMSQLVNPERYGLFTLLYNSEGPEGEMLSEYAEKEWKHQPHIGETPVDVINDVTDRGNKAVAAIEKASPYIKANSDEFNRLKNDMYCYQALAGFYAEKAQAALLVLKYKYSKNIADLQAAIPHVQQSVNYFTTLANLTKSTYLYANSMQTQQRKIPVGGNNGKNKTWVELLPYYQKELQNFKHNVDSMQAHQNDVVTAQAIVRLPAADVTLIGNQGTTYTFADSAAVFTDSIAAVKISEPILHGLKAVKYNKAMQLSAGTSITFSTKKPVKLLIGFFNEKSSAYSPEPQLETDASANDYGQAEIKIANAVVVDGLPSVNVHAYAFDAGTHTLNLAKGAVLVLGFVPADAKIPVYDAGLNKGGANRYLDALFN